MKTRTVLRCQSSETRSHHISDSSSTMADLTRRGILSVLLLLLLLALCLATSSARNLQVAVVDELDINDDVAVVQEPEGQLSPCAWPLARRSQLLRAEMRCQSPHPHTNRIGGECQNLVRPRGSAHWDRSGDTFCVRRDAASSLSAVFSLFTSAFQHLSP